MRGTHCGCICSNVSHQLSSTFWPLCSIEIYPFLIFLLLPRQCSTYRTAALRPPLKKRKVSVDEFHGHLDSQATKFSERVFAILDQDMSGLLDLREFIVGVWNYSTYDTQLVSKVLLQRPSLFQALAVKLFLVQAAAISSPILCRLLAKAMLQ